MRVGTTGAAVQRCPGDRKSKNLYKTVALVF